MSDRHDYTTSVSPEALRCVTCREWKIDADFPLNRATNIVRRGRHTQCRECNTVAKRLYRSKSGLESVTASGDSAGQGQTGESGEPRASGYVTRSNPEHTKPNTKVCCRLDVTP